MKRLQTTLLIAMLAAIGLVAVGCGKDGEGAGKCDGAQLGDRQLPLPLGAWWHYRTSSGVDKTFTVASGAEQLPDDWTFIGSVAEACDKRERSLIRLDVEIEQDGEIVETGTRYMTQDEVSLESVDHTGDVFNTSGTRIAATAFCPAYTGDPDNIYDGQLLLDEAFLADDATFPKNLVYRWFERTFDPGNDTIYETVEWEVNETWMPDGSPPADEEVTVKAGTFTCKKLVRTQQFELIAGTPEQTTKPDREQTLWFAANVGLVKVETTGSDDDSYELRCWGD
jgi:hypothetical protein